MDEHESAVAAWLDLPGTQREIQIARRRLALMGSDPSLAWMLALGVEMLAEMNFSGDPGPDPTFPDPDDDDEPWKPKAA